MPVTVVIGGQFGSEGKGKVACEFARMRNASVAVRTGGSNSGHTVIDSKGNPKIFRHLPTAAILESVICVIGPGTYLDVDVLLAEVAEIGLPPERLLIDENAVIISDKHKQLEGASGLIEGIGSTGSGTGAAVIERISRSGSVAFAKNDPRIPKQCLGNTRQFLRKSLNRNERIILEGTQGFGLSLLHSDDYPNVTSRDTTAAAFIAEAGLSPLDVEEVVMVIRAFPIRVAGNSGHLPNETDWNTITRLSGSPTQIIERTTVTRKVRRVAEFDADVVRAAIEVNLPSCIALNHVDYFDHECQKTNAFSVRALGFVGGIEEQIGRPIDFVGFGQSSLVACVKSGNMVNVS